MTFLAYSVERIAYRIAYSVERIAYSKNKYILYSFLSAIRYPLSAKEFAIPRRWRGRRYPLSAKRGFTLLELLVVILIISIALGFLTPLFRKTFLDISLNSSAQDIVSLMRYARERAIIENASFRLNLDVENGSYWLTMEEPDKQAYSKLRGNLGRLYTIAGELKMESQENNVDFYPDGEVGNVRIKITNPNNNGLIITLKSGAGSNIVVRDENDEE